MDYLIEVKGFNGADNKIHNRTFISWGESAADALNRITHDLGDLQYLEIEVTSMDKITSETNGKYLRIK